LVICNGGSPTTYQALAAGAPVLALASTNMDQHLNMEAVRHAGAGHVLRAKGVEPSSVGAAATTILEDAKFKAAAARISNALRGYDAKTRLPRLIEEIVAN